MVFVVWYGVVWHSMVWYGMVWYGMVWYGMVWYGMVWYGMVWYGMVWYGMVWYGMIKTAVKPWTWFERSYWLDQGTCTICSLLVPYLFLILSLAPKAAPKNVSSLSRSLNNLTVIWSHMDNTWGEIKHYRVHLYLGHRKIQNMTTDKNYLTFNGLNKSTIYFFQVQAATSKGEGPLCNRTSGRTLIGGKRSMKCLWNWEILFKELVNGVGTQYLW